MFEQSKRDMQTVIAGGARFAPPEIDGVMIHEVGNILTRSGIMAEIFRKDWPGFDIGVQQVNWVQLNAGGVTDWHCHAQQTDRLISVGGNIKLALWDGRPHSKSYRTHEIIRFGSARPVVAVVPPGVWHGLRNESGDFAGYINVIDVLYAYERPDNFRAPSQSESKELPDIL